MCAEETFRSGASVTCSARGKVILLFGRRGRFFVRLDILPDLFYPGFFSLLLLLVQFFLALFVFIIYSWQGSSFWNMLPGFFFQIHYQHYSRLLFLNNQGSLEISVVRQETGGVGRAQPNALPRPQFIESLH